MATTFTTTINSMYTIDTPDPGYVVNALWQVTGVDGEYTASIGGNTQFNSADQEGAFIPYDQLTEATVIGWIPDVCRANWTALPIRLSALRTHHCLGHNFNGKPSPAFDGTLKRKYHGKRKKDPCDY
jgi:hypothetical protein